MLALLILLAIFTAGFAAGYGIRELRSPMRRRRIKRVAF
jgi:hypothetical protein